MDDKMRLRARRKLLRVTLPDGRIICRSTAANTMIETLQEIPPQRYPEITLEMCHHPLLAQESIPRFKDFMKPIAEGWWVNTQSNTDTKYLQLRAISNALDLGFIVELGEDFEPQNTIRGGKGPRKKTRMSVVFPDGEIVSEQSSGATFVRTIQKLGIAEVKRCDISWGGRPLIASARTDNRLEQLDERHWVTTPTNTRDRMKLLRVIAAHLRVPLTITAE